jgi:uncharacterized damage-inducible protein DinB
MSLPLWKEVLASQHGAALDMLENAMLACPETLWADASVPVDRQFWYLAFHTLWWHHHYSSETDQGYRPPAPFTMDETDPAGVYPASPYSRETLLAFLEHGRGHCAARIAALTEDQAAAPCAFERRNMPVLELLLYDLRHVQHHAAQLNVLLRQHTNSAPRWVGRGRRP